MPYLHVIIYYVYIYIHVTYHKWIICRPLKSLGCSTATAGRPDRGSVLDVHLPQIPVDPVGLGPSSNSKRYFALSM